MAFQAADTEANAPSALLTMVSQTTTQNPQNKRFALKGREMRRRMNLGLWSRESHSAQLGRASKYTIETLLPGCEDVRSGALSGRVAWGGWFPGLKPG
jgi:hypothetical protein